MSWSNTIPNYAQLFERQLYQKYAKELVSGDLTDQGVKWLNAQTVNIPNVTLSGFKAHSRAGGFSAGTITHSYKAKTLEYDRSVSFFVDVMDVDETNMNLEAARITNTFEKEHAIPELDAYRFSKLYTAYKALADASSGAYAVDTTALTQHNILLKFDEFMGYMDDAGVPQDGRILYVTYAIYKLIKHAAGIYRTFNTSDSGTAMSRVITSLDNVKIKVVPGDRFRSAYTMTTGFVPAAGAKYINMILLHPSAVIAVQKHSAIYLHPPGSHTEGDGWLYQTRRYGDLFIIDAKVAGIRMNATDSGPEPPVNLVPMAYSVAANGDSTNQDTSEIVVTFADGVADLTTANFELSGEGAEHVTVASATPSNGNKTYTLAVTVASAGNAKNVKVAVDDDSFLYTPLVDTVKVYKY